MARPVGKLGPVPAGRGIGLWSPHVGVSGPFITNYMLLPFDWGVPFGPPPLLQTWAVGPNPNLLPPPAPAFVGPFNQDDWPLPRGYEYPLSLRFWSKGPAPVFVDNSKFSLPFDWGTPEGPQPLLQTWTFSSRVLFAAVVAPFSQDDWPLPGRFTPLPQSWTWTYNYNLIGKDQLPTGADLTDLPPRPYPEPATRTWAFAFNLNLIGKDRLPTGAEIYDLAPIAPLQILPRSWTWSYNLNLIAKDALVTGKQVFDLSPKGYEYPISLRSWINYTLPLFAPVSVPFAQDDWPLPKAPAPIQQTWTWAYNYNLIAQDAMITGEQVYDLAPRGYPEPATRTWTFAFNLNLIGRDRLTAGKQSYDLAPIAPSQILPRSWTWSYNLNLTGQDQLPTGEQRYDLAPVGPFYATQLRTWIYFTPPTPTFAIPFNQFDWPTPKPYPEPATRTWAWSYNLNLVAQDSMLVGEQVYDLSPIAQPQTLPRSWTLNLQQSTLQPIPYGKQWWERAPLGPIQPLREWAWRYNLNLVAQDAMITGKQVYDLAPVGYIYPAQLRTWVDKRILPLDIIAAALPYNQFDWPVPKGPLQPDRFYNFSFPRVLIGRDATATGKQVYDLTTPAPQRSIQLNTWTASYNLNLIAQDSRVVGSQVTDLSPRDHLRLGQLRVWFERFNPNLIGKDVLPTGDQYYDFPRPPLQPTSIFVASFNKNLVGKDKLPTGDQYFDLAPRGHITPRDVINWVNQVNIALKFPPPPPTLVGAIIPFDWAYPSDWGPDWNFPAHLRSFISGANLCLGIPSVPIPPAPVPVGPQFVHNPGNEWQIYDRIREPGPVGWR